MSQPQSPHHATWIAVPALHCVKYIAEETKLGATLQRAITALSHQEWLLLYAKQGLVRAKKPTAQINELLAQQKTLGEWAKAIIAEDYNGINKHSIVGLWVAIEVAVEDTVVAALVNGTNVLAGIEKSGVKIPEGLSVPISDFDARRLYSRMERTLRKSKSVGDGYSSILSSIDVYISIPAESIALLDEFNYVRNCLLHRGGIADEKIYTEAPGLNLQPGEAIQISSSGFLHYYDSAADFAKALLSAAMASRHMQKQAS